MRIYFLAVAAAVAGVVSLVLAVSFAVLGMIPAWLT